MAIRKLHRICSNPGIKIIKRSADVFCARWSSITFLSKCESILIPWKMERRRWTSLLAPSLARFKSSELFSISNALIYAFSVGTLEKSQRRVFNVCNHIRHKPNIFKTVKTSMKKRTVSVALKCIEVLSNIYCG